jgi:uncharacterized protein involved in type VI secretion and phage assembly
MTYDKRFYGIYEGICTNSFDPDNKNRIKLQVPQILGTAETDWAPACLAVVTTTIGTITFSNTPYIGQKVWVMFIAGDPNFPVWVGVEV